MLQICHSCRQANHLSNTLVLAFRVPERVHKSFGGGEGPEFALLVTGRAGGGGSWVHAEGGRRILQRPLTRNACHRHRQLTSRPYCSTAGRSDVPGCFCLCVSNGCGCLLVLVL